MYTVRVYALKCECTRTFEHAPQFKFEFSTKTVRVGALALSVVGEPKVYRNGGSEASRQTSPMDGARRQPATRSCSEHLISPLLLYILPVLSD